MAYNSFPAVYPQYAQAPYQPFSAAPTQQSTNTPMTWVQGESGAKSYLVAPNQTVVLWDSEAQVIYIKTADGSGMPSIKTLEYTVRDAMPGYKSEIEQLKSEIADLRRRYESLIHTDESTE